jgi:hypothetical protein
MTHRPRRVSQRRPHVRGLWLSASQLGLVVVLASAVFGSGCTSRDWFSQARDDNSRGLPQLVIQPEELAAPVVFHVQVHAAPGSSWCLALFLRGGTFFDGANSSNSRCAKVLVDDRGAYDYPLTVTGPLSGSGAVLADLYQECSATEAGVPLRDMCGRGQSLKTASWPLNTPTQNDDGGTVDATPSEHAPTDGPDGAAGADDAAPVSDGKGG